MVRALIVPGRIGRSPIDPVPDVLRSEIGRDHRAATAAIVIKDATVEIDLRQATVRSEIGRRAVTIATEATDETGHSAGRQRTRSRTVAAVTGLHLGLIDPIVPVVLIGQRVDLTPGQGLGPTAGHPPDDRVDPAGLRPTAGVSSRRSVGHSSPRRFVPAEGVSKAGGTRSIGKRLEGSEPGNHINQTGARRKVFGPAKSWPKDQNSVVI